MAIPIACHRFHSTASAVAGLCGLMLALTTVWAEPSAPSPKSTTAPDAAADPSAQPAPPVHRPKIRAPQGRRAPVRAVSGQATVWDTNLVCQIRRRWDVDTGVPLLTDEAWTVQRFDLKISSQAKKAAFYEQGEYAVVTSPALYRWGDDTVMLQADSRDVELSAGDRERARQGQFELDRSTGLLSQWRLDQRGRWQLAASYQCDSAGKTKF